MNEWDLYKKLEEVNKLFEEYKKGELKKDGLYDWKKQIERESRALTEKYFQTQTSGNRCPTCNGTGSV